jgi:hypothetical protein
VKPIDSEIARKYFENKDMIVPEPDAQRKYTAEVSTIMQELE